MSVKINVGANTRQAEKGLKAVTDAIKILDTTTRIASNRMADNFDNLSNELKELAKNQNRSSNANKGMTKSFIAGQAIWSAAQKAFSMIAKEITVVIDKASELQEVTAKFGTVFEGAFSEAESAVDNLTESYGQSEIAARKMLSSTGDLLTGLGFMDDTALSLSEQVATLAVDVASFSNIEGGAERASEALTKGLLGEREMMKSLGIVIGEADIKAQLLARGQENLTGTALRQAKAEITLELALQQSQKALGDYARTQDSFANQQRRIEANVEDLEAKFGQLLLPVLQQSQRSFLAITDAINNFLSDGSKLQGIISKISGALAVLQRFIADIATIWFKNFREQLSPLTTLLSELFATMENNSGIFKTLATLTQLVTATFSVLAKINKTIIQGLIDVGKAAVQAAQVFSTAIDVLRGKKKFGEVKKELNDVKKALTDLTKNVKDNTADIVDETISQFANFSSEIGKNAKLYEDINKKATKEVLDDYAANEKKKTEITEEETEKRTLVSAKWVQDNKDAIASLGELTAETIANMSEGFTAIPNTIGNIGSSLVSNFSKAFSVIADKSAGLGDKIAAGIGAGLQVVSDISGQLFDLQQQGFDNQIKQAEKAYAKELDGLEEKEESRVEIAQEALDTLLEQQMMNDEAFDEARMAELESYRANLQGKTDADINKALEDKEREILSARDADKLRNQQAIADAKAKLDEAKRNEALEAKKAKAKEKFEKKKLQIAKRAFEANKAAQIAQVWIQAAIGIVGAWAQSIAQLGPIGGSIAAGVLTALILATAGAQTGVISGQQFPGFADGVTGFEGGTALVGERGPELVTLGRGSNVVTNENTSRLLDALSDVPADTNRGININGPITVMANDPESFYEQMIELERVELARR
jgi:hypothetical protein